MVLDQLKRILNSESLHASARSRGFLRFVVEQALAGRSDRISQEAIAAEVMGRTSGFDSATDPIVRMQAGRVRRSLEHYYRKEGGEDVIEIALPKGTYVPTFSFRTPPAAIHGSGAGNGSAGGCRWPALFISPLENLTGSRDMEFVARGLASDLAVELARDKSIQVFLAPAGGMRSATGGFELSGTLSKREDSCKINLHLTDRESGQQTWAHTCMSPTVSGMGARLDRLVQQTVTTIAEEHGVLSSHFSGDQQRRASLGSAAYEAILRYHHFDQTHEPEAFAEALAALRQAVAAKPDCAVCWSYLARLGGSHWSLGAPGRCMPIEGALDAACRGVELAPTDVRCRVILAFVLLITDEVAAARDEAEVALRLIGNSVFWLDAIGYLLVLSGDWERGVELIRRALRINPFPRRACHSALWLDAIRREDPAAALAAARELAPETYFWAPLMEAVALVANARSDEAAGRVADLLRMKPDFLRHGHWLITRYVKDEDLAQRIERALEDAHSTAGILAFSDNPTL